MSEMSDKIDREVGQDTEQARINFLKYVNYGRQLLSEEQKEQGVFTTDVVNAMLKDNARLTAELIFKELDAIDAQVTDAQSVVEKADEDEALESLKRQSDITKPEIAALLSSFEALLKSVDEKHTAIIRDIRIAKIQALKDSYLA